MAQSRQVDRARLQHLHIKSFDEDARIIRGIATTPQTDRQDDIVEPRGAIFNCRFHSSLHMIQSNLSAMCKKPTSPMPASRSRSSCQKIPEPGKLKDRLDEAWQSIKYGLVKGLSIGFQGSGIGTDQGLDLGPPHQEMVLARAFGRGHSGESNQHPSPQSRKSIRTIAPSPAKAKCNRTNRPSPVIRQNPPQSWHPVPSNWRLRQMPMTNTDRMKGLEEKRAAEMAALESYPE